MNERLDNLTRQWASLGAGFGAEPSVETPDLERLLLETARHATGMARLFIMAATWLHTYGDLIAKHRLKRLIRDELEPEYQPVLGLMLDFAQQGTHPLEFQSVITSLRRASRPRPLFAAEQENPKLAERAHRNASPLSRHWNLWCQPIEFKSDAMRPSRWMMSRHAALVTRADFRGDLRASILASLQHDEHAGDSELRLARMAGGSRAQVRSSLRNLEMTGRITTGRSSERNRREVMLMPPTTVQ